MDFKKNVINIIFILFSIVPVISDATNIRGRIDGANQYYRAAYPLGGVAVDLYMQSPQGWRPAGRYITGSDGMYYFQNIFPGNYSIQINGRQNYPLTVFNQPYQDLPPIFLNY